MIEYTSPRLLRPAGLLAASGLFATASTPPPADAPSEADDVADVREAGCVKVHFLFRHPAPHRHFFLFEAFLDGVEGGGGDGVDPPLVVVAEVVGAGVGTTVQTSAPDPGEEEPAADG